MAAQGLKEIATRDFTGGLSFAPPQELGPNEVAFAKDIDFSSRGGFSARNGFRPFAAEANANRVEVMGVHHKTADTTEQLIVTDPVTDHMLWCQGGKWFDSGALTGDLYGFLSDGTPVGPTFAQYQDKSYFVTPVGADFIWNGFTAQTVGTAFSDNIAAPSSTPNIPSSYIIAVKGDFAFVAVTNESNVQYKSRIRWSHPGRPDNWRTVDFNDLPMSRITALVPYRDFLAIFSDDELWALFGDSTESFSFQALSHTTGTPFHRSVAASPSTLYWWDWDQGVMAMVGSREPVSIFDKVKPYLERRGFVSSNAGTNLVNPPILCWGEGRLYVQFPNLNSAEFPNDPIPGHIFVFDPKVGKNGTWTTYEHNGGVGITTYPLRYQNDQVVSGGLTGRGIVLNDKRLTLDRNFAYDATDKAIVPAVLRTAPFAGSTNATKKRWRRPRVTIRSSGSKMGLNFGYRPNYKENRTASAAVHPIVVDHLPEAGVGSGVWDATGWTDLFGSQDTTKWSGYDSVNILTTGGRMREIVSVGNPRSLTTVSTWDLTYSGFVVEVMTAPTGASAFMQLVVFNPASNANLSMGIFTATGNIFMTYRLEDGTAGANVTFGPMDLVNLDWWRIREQAGTFYWDTSPDGVTWTNRRNIPSPFLSWNLNNTKAQLACSAPTSGGSQTVEWDNFSYVTDVSNTNLWDTSKWAYDTGSGTELPANFIQFETLPSGGAGNAFQLEFQAITGTVGPTTTGQKWGVDSIVLPYREKGIR